jgi:NAD(P)-dependent dehydrogenase (short-subunit alcohol dehydrogenase family)
VGSGLEEKVCVVTGSADGIGRATAVEMARRGARVVVSDVNDDMGAETVKLAEEAGGEAHYIHCDVRDVGQVEALMTGAAERFGGIDVLHNNAGVHESAFTTELAVDTLPLEVWDAVYEINLRGVWYCTRFAAPYLKQSTRGPAIVNAASTGGHTGYPMLPIYGPTKGGVLQLTKVTAVDLAPVRCNSYSPGSTDTAMIRGYTEAAEDKEAVWRTQTETHLIRRLGDPIDIARLVCFLASDEAAWITGQDFLIDGGSLAWRGHHND